MKRFTSFLSSRSDHVVRERRGSGEISFLPTLRKYEIPRLRFASLGMTSIFLFFLAFTFSSYAYAAPPGNYLVMQGGRAETTVDVLPSSSFSFSAWIRPKKTDGISPLLSIGSQSGNVTNYQVAINGGSLQLSYRYGTGSQRTLAAGYLVPDIWQYVETVITEQQTTIFIDGMQVITTGGAMGLSGVGPAVVLGAPLQSSFFGTAGYSGDIDEVNIDTDAWFLVWHMDEARGQTVATDSSGNEIHATLAGGDPKVHFFGVLPTPTPWIFPINRPPFISGEARPTGGPLPTLPPLTFPTFGVGRITPPVSVDNPLPTIVFPTIRNPRLTGFPSFR